MSKKFFMIAINKKMGAKETHGHVQIFAFKNPKDAVKFMDVAVSGGFIEGCVAVFQEYFGSMGVRISEEAKKLSGDFSFGNGEMKLDSLVISGSVASALFEKTKNGATTNKIPEDDRQPLGCTVNILGVCGGLLMITSAVNWTHVVCNSDTILEQFKGRLFALEGKVFEDVKATMKDGGEKKGAVVYNMKKEAIDKVGEILAENKILITNAI